MNIVETKTFWGGLAAIATGVGLIIAGAIPEGIQTITTGALAVFLRLGILKRPR